MLPELQNLDNFLSDSAWFWVFESILALVTIIAITKSTFPEESPISGLSRGDKSRKFLLKTATGLMTFVVTVVFNITTSPKDGLVILYLINLLWIFYLCLINAWSTNKLIGLLVKFENRDFNPHKSLKIK